MKKVEVESKLINNLRRVESPREHFTRFSSPVLTLFGILLFASCEDPHSPPPPCSTAPVLIRESFDSVNNIAGKYFMGVSVGSKVFTITPLREITVNHRFDVLVDSVRFYSLGGEIITRWRYVCANKSGTRLLLVRSMYNDISIGGLFEYDVGTHTLSLLRDSAYRVSSAVYLSDERSAIYYSYGSSDSALAPGYYLYSDRDQPDSLILQHISETSALEAVNGFDLHPNNRTLIIPVHFNSRTPLIIEYDLIDKHSDTISIPFDKQFVWLRYNGAGSQLVYSNYPSGVLSGAAFDTTEIGIIDRSTWEKKPISVQLPPAYTEEGRSIKVFPTWASDNEHILFGNAYGPSNEPPGAIGTYSLFALKTY